MIPWPIALLCAFYAVLATSSAAAVWHITTGRLQGSLAWFGFWCAVSAVLVVGLAQLKPWARVLATWASALMMLSALGLALLVILTANPEPRRSVLATGIAVTHLLAVRYLTRPHVKGWFIEHQTGSSAVGSKP